MTAAEQILDVLNRGPGAGRVAATGGAAAHPVSDVNCDFCGPLPAVSSVEALTAHARSVGHLRANASALGFRIYGPDDVDALAERIADAVSDPTGTVGPEPMHSARIAARVACGVTDG